MSIAFNFHNDVLTVVVKNKVYNINKDDERFAAVKKALKENDEEALFLSFDKAQVFKNYVETQTGGRVTYVDNKVLLDGKELHNVIVDRIREFAKNGLPFEHLLKFIENITKNPSYRAQEELFTFLEHKYLPVTEDGCFYAYKSIRGDWMDIYSGTINNSIGNEITMDRNRVDDDKDRGCSKGLHCGSIEYVKNYGCAGSRIIIVKVNPMDVVSIPKDCSCQKMRVCRYICWAEYVKPLEKPLYGDTIKYDDDYDDDWEDDGWDDLDDDWDSDEEDEEDDWNDDEEDDWDDDDDYEEEDDEDDDWDDNVTDKDVTISKVPHCVHNPCKFYSKRDKKGRFTK